MKGYYYLLGLIAVAIMVRILGMKLYSSRRRRKVNHFDTDTDYTQGYQAKYLLTKNEWHEYRKLKEYAGRMNLQVCPKVRLLDIIEPRSGSDNYMALIGKIQSKHVDFVICDQNLYVKAILELDDNSHNRPDRKERDSFVDEILTSVGYKVIRTRSITEDTLKPLTTTSTIGKQNKARLGSDERDPTAHQHGRT